MVRGFEKISFPQYKSDNLDIEYYSNNQYISGHQELFSADGLHLTPGFYKDYWLKDLILTMGL